MVIYVLQKKAVDDTVVYRRNTNGYCVTSEEKMMSVIYIAYPEECSLGYNSREGWVVI
jgi:predicted RNA-binding protein (virulence factor B family)